MKRIVATDTKRSAPDPANDSAGHLDDLRSEFLLDLSHQLRTPVTAMKLAMDGLLSQIQNSLSPSQRNLARISRRNLESVAALVERQLALLRVMSGDHPVRRRLVDLDGLIEDLGRRQGDGVPARGGRLRVERTSQLEKDGPLYAVTDPEQLVVVLDCVLAVGAPNATRTVRVDYDDDRCVFRLDIRVDLTGRDSPEGTGRGLEAPPAHDFETRACQAVIERLGGEMIIDKDDSYRRASIRLPRFCDDDE
jgi:hypothetical protein